MKQQINNTMNKEESLVQVFHPYDLWEDHKNGFYNNISGKNKTEMIQKVVDFFSDSPKVEVIMTKVIENWFYSCEHNLTNASMNKVAYIGQASLSYLHGIPSTVTMEAWSSVPKEFQAKSNEIAEIVYQKWLDNYDRVLLMRSQDNKC